MVDTTIVSIALPSIRRELGFSGAEAQWILGGYALAFGGLLPPVRPGGRPLRQAPALAGRARRFRRRLPRRGLAPSPRVLVAARFLQGAGGAALSLLTAAFAEGEARNRAIGVYGAMAALGFVVGMVGEV